MNEDIHREDIRRAVGNYRKLIYGLDLKKPSVKYKIKEKSE